MPPPTIIFRHRKENLKKCSLSGLESREDLSFYKYPIESLPALENYLVLSLDGPVLTKKDAAQGIVLIDGTWKYAEKMFKHVNYLPKRSLPNQYRTAYPRKQTDCINPETGLASVEALYLTYKILHRDSTGLLDQYHWKDEFLQINELI